MKCPHCKKPISHVLKGKAAKRAEELHDRGISTRDIQLLLTLEGHQVSTATVQRFFRDR